jgi:hypothetical protein
MGFSKHKTWDNRDQCDKKQCVNGRTWTRRITWMVDENDQVKLKMESCVVGFETYKEVLCSQADATTIWNRFKEGQSFDDCISIIGRVPPKALQSRKMSQKKGG